MKISIVCLILLGSMTAFAAEEIKTTSLGIYNRSVEVTPDLVESCWNVSQGGDCTLKLFAQPSVFPISKDFEKLTLKHDFGGSEHEFVFSAVSNQIRIYCTGKIPESLCLNVIRDFVTNNPVKMKWRSLVKEVSD